MTLGARVAEGATAAGHRLTALFLVLLVSPVLLLIAGLVRVTSAGPVLFRQERVGQFGRRFVIYKFRTMEHGSHSRLDEVLAANGMDGITPFFKIQQDPRVTRIGRVLRRTSLDELPQLFNVVLGHMSLVGPRPQSPAEVATYDARVWRRLLVKPGVTGLWQVSGRSDLSAHEGLELDLEYVREWSPGLDLKVLARTPRAVVWQRGAY